MTPFAFASVMLLLAAIFGLINHHTLRLPSTIGVMVVALGFSVLLVLIDPFIGDYDLTGYANSVLDAANLSHLLLDSVLAFLLFAGSLHVDLAMMRVEKWPILALASIGTLTATVLLALGMWGVFALVGSDVPLTWCFVLGSLLAPTDPVAVSALLAKVGLPKPLQIVITGESLFNDGIAVVVFLLALDVATGQVHEIGLGHVAVEFIREVGGGVVLGALAGVLAYRGIGLADDKNLELTISLACATVTYTLAQELGVSGPIAVVIAGLLVGNNATAEAISVEAREHIIGFWSLVDEILNTLLFLLIGLEVLAIERDTPIFLAILCAIPLACLVRLLSVGGPLMAVSVRAMPRGLTSRVRNVGVLTWGGLRGGISVALALSLPASAYRGSLLAVCYGLVVFTIIGQGLTMPWAVRRLLAHAIDPEAAPGAH